MLESAYTLKALLEASVNEEMQRWVIKATSILKRS